MDEKKAKTAAARMRAYRERTASVVAIGGVDEADMTMVQLIECLKRGGAIGQSAWREIGRRNGYAA